MERVFTSSMVFFFHAPSFQVSQIATKIGGEETLSSQPNLNEEEKQSPPLNPEPQTQHNERVVSNSRKQYMLPQYKFFATFKLIK